MIEACEVAIKPYYQDDAVTLYHGDCREILPTLPRHDLLLTDPPYGYGWNTNYSRFSRGTSDKKQIANDASREEIDLPMVLSMADEQIVFGCNSLTHDKPGSYLIWDKRCADGFAFLSDGEAAWWSRGHGVYIKSINAQSFRSRAGLHPTQKPVELFAWCLTKCPDAATILDPFAGSGTTGVAAKLEGRKATLIEMEERYCEIAANRLSQGVLF
jgi:site-specific DNA-methyltransferase (adenine-specific)